MKPSRCSVCFLRRVIGNAADSLDDVQTRVLLHVLKRYAGVDFAVRG